MDLVRMMVTGFVYGFCGTIGYVIAMIVLKALHVA